jgi:hypothetical protein
VALDIFITLCDAKLSFTKGLPQEVNTPICSSGVVLLHLKVLDLAKTLTVNPDPKTPTNVGCFAKLVPHFAPRYLMVAYPIVCRVKMQCLSLQTLSTK